MVLSLPESICFTPKHILFHLPVPIEPGGTTGTQGRILGMLNYFKDRRDILTVDAVSSNPFGKPEWTLDYRQYLLNFVDRVFIYEGERNWLDFLYTRSQSFYHQRLLTQQLPVDSDYSTPPGYVQFVRSLLRQQHYDWFWVNNVDYAHLAVKQKLADTKTLIDMHDIASRLRLVRKNIDYSKHLTFDYEKNLAQEIKLIRQFDTVIIDSQYEKKLLSEHLRFEQLKCIPHQFAEATLDTTAQIPYSSREFEYDILFVGSINQPNKDGLNFFLKSVFPKIVAQKQTVKFAIAGKISSQVEIDESVKANVYSPGFVPSIAELYLKSRLVVCPLLTGAGTKFKLVEAIAYGMPVVTTDTCASALKLVNGVNSFITDDPDQYADYVLHLINHPAMANRFSEAMKLLHHNEHSESAIYQKLDAILQVNPQLVSSR